jgi:2-amino-4-hydroxy-6-hydroxymethyldihydropteridine diphosphokinase
MIYYLSLGANIGEREQTLREAIQQFEQHVGKILRCSSFYYSEPWGFESDHPFCNLCCSVESTLTPLEVLHRTQTIERALGRTRKSENGIYSDRTIDIDIIRAFDNENKEIYIDTPELTLPHQLWQERDFVKVPLAQIMP